MGKNTKGKKYVSPHVEFTIAAQGKVFDFVNNTYIAKNEEECKIIENCKGYGKYIFPLEKLVNNPDKPDKPQEKPETPPVYVCEFCEEQFETKEQLAAHVVVCPAKDGGEDEDEKDESEPPSFKCELCGKEFPTVQGLNGHMASCRKKHEE